MTTKSARIPLWVKIAYTAFVAVMVPVYLHEYGPTNFLYFCDVAVLMTVVALWWENSLWASMPAVGIVLPQVLWQVDFLGTLFGWPVMGMTGYMFDERKSLFLRGLSFFHFWLPLLLVWIVWRLGYDRRAFLLWTLLAYLLIVICFFFMPAPPAPADNPNLPVNIDYVWGLSDEQPQTWMSSALWVASLMVLLPSVIFLPTHLVLARLFGSKRTRET